jgi:hypothetical protein
VADSAHGPSSAGDTEVGCWAVEAFLVAPALFGGETLPFERSMLSVQKINIFSFPLCCWLLVNPVALADCFFLSCYSYLLLILKKCTNIFLLPFEQFFVVSWDL